VTAITFLILSTIDVRKRKISLSIIIAGVTSILIDGLVLLKYPVSALDLISAVVFIITGAASHGKFGMADAVILAALSVSFGSFAAIFSYFAAALLAKIVITIRRKNSVAFIPYIFAGFACFEAQAFGNLYH